MEPTPNPVSTDPGWVFYGCKRNGALTSRWMQRVIIKRIRRAGFQVLNDAFTKFEGAGGYTHVVIIGESCIDVHTWPEHGTAHVRIFYCNFTQDNTGKAERLLASFKELFEPSTVKEHAGREYPAVL